MKLGMMYTDDAKVASSNVTCHHKPRVWETSSRNLGTLANLRHARVKLQNIKIRSPGYRTVGSM